MKNILVNATYHEKADLWFDEMWVFERVQQLCHQGQKKFEEMIHAHVEVERNIRNVIEIFNL